MNNSVYNDLYSQLSKSEEEGGDSVLINQNNFFFNLLPPPHDYVLGSRQTSQEKGRCHLVYVLRSPEVFCFQQADVGAGHGDGVGLNMVGLLLCARHFACTISWHCYEIV